MKKQQKNLETDRLILRPLTQTDAKIIQKKTGDADIAEMTLTIPHPYPDGLAEEWIATHYELFQKGELINYGITLKDSGRLIGVVDLRVEKKHNRAELGYWLDKNKWGKGYMTEAARALLDYGFNEHNLHKIVGMHFTKNPASGAVMKKLGMREEGVLREHELKNGEYLDAVTYGILNREWKKLNKK